MAKKVNKKKVETRKDEIRITTADPKRMLNKYICKKVLKTWKETFFDHDTGKPCEIERNEVLFEKGTLITRDVLQKIQFSQAAGECKEIEVSNQNREAYELENTALYPYSVNVRIGKDNLRFILYACGIENVLEIMRDYLELNRSGGFVFTAIKEMDSCIILTDEMSKENIDVAYIQDKIDMETYINAKTESKEDEEPIREDQKKFFQMDMKITYDDGVELHQSFIVNTIDTNRALVVISRYLQECDEKRKERAEKEGGEYQVRTATLCIEKAVPMPAKGFVPKEFSLVYNEK